MSTVPDFLATIAATTARRSSHVALEFGDARWTFAELDAVSNRLAHRLVSMGVRPESLVGVSLTRGPAELVAMLATAKANGAYVPMVPTHPLERLLVVKEDAAPQVMIVDSKAPMAACAGERVIVLDDLVDATAGWDPAPLAIDPDPQQLAYVMFTSGSTGRPKGVEVPRGALSNFLHSMAHTPGLHESDRLLAITTTAFDIAGLELFLPLFVGATVVLADFDTTRDPRLLRRRLERGDISIMQATPAMWRLLLEAGWQGDAALRILCGGEAMTPTLADALLANCGELWNMYGPTETTIWSSLQRIEPGYDRITIGTAIDATDLVVLDEHANLVATGTEGEVGIGGDGLARGYKGRPELTAERFVVLPDGRRVYRTGDLGRELADGRMEWLGRLDHQVKIRGFRVELGEIQTILHAVPGVAEVIVVADPRSEGDPRLIAYWVGTARREDLVHAARRHLPGYMVPASYVLLDDFPLNTNGKIDRAKLPMPETMRDMTVLPALARNDTETRIAAAWRDVLGVPVIPRDQDFFTLGGTSVLATQVVMRLERELGVEIPLSGFFQQPTVEGMAARLGDGAARDAPIVVRLRHGPADRAPLFCLFGVHLYQDLALALDDDRPVIGAHVPFRYVPGRDTRPSLTEIAARYVELIRSHQAHGPYDLLGLCFGGIVAYEVARQLEAAGERVANVAVIDAILPNAVRVDTARRLRAYVGSAQRALREPHDFERWLRKGGESLAARVPLLGRLRQAAAGLTNGVTPIDLPIDGPEVEAEVRRFAGASSRLSARLLIVRALGEQTPDWMAVDATHGWGRRAKEVRVHDIHADHLGVLRDPHVRSLARALVE